MIKKYDAEKNKNKNLTMELKELDIKYKRAIEANNKIISKRDKYLMKMEFNNKRHSNNNSFEINKEEKENDNEKIEPKSSHELIKMYKDNFDEMEGNKMKQKYKQNSQNILEDINEDNISISDSFSNENQKINLKEKKEKINKKEEDESETISENNPEYFKEIERIMNINIIQSDIEKYNEKTNSSFKDDKSTKMDIDKI